MHTGHPTSFGGSETRKGRTGSSSYRSVSCKHQYFEQQTIVCNLRELDVRCVDTFDRMLSRQTAGSTSAGPFSLPLPEQHH
eukprot:3287532-Amphidinium_carterae.1